MKFITFFKRLTPVQIVLLGIAFIGIGKIIERFSKDIALGCQLFSFVLVMYAFIKYFNSK
ncbi:MAG: hypothetical protein KA488_03365 [Flavobacterium sp.]|nr:hypothetical protein [Flavobacterium sp.]MBP6099648.1 hypothetical protein [Flavobacterium sp.]